MKKTLDRIVPHKAGDCWDSLFFSEPDVLFLFFALSMFFAPSDSAIPLSLGIGAIIVIPLPLRSYGIFGRCTILLVLQPCREPFWWH